MQFRLDEIALAIHNGLEPRVAVRAQMTRSRNNLIKLARHRRGVPLGHLKGNGVVAPQAAVPVNEVLVVSSLKAPLTALLWQVPVKLTRGNYP